MEQFTYYSMAICAAMGGYFWQKADNDYKKDGGGSSIFYRAMSFAMIACTMLFLFLIVSDFVLRLTEAILPIQN